MKNIKIFATLILLVSVFFVNAQGPTNVWQWSGNTINSNSALIGNKANRSVYLITNNTRRIKLDSVGQLRVFTSNASTSYVDQTWERWAIKGAAYTGSFGAVYDGFWLGTTSQHNLNFFTNNNIPAITISSLTSGAVNAVKINPATYTHNAQFCVNAGGGTDIVQFKNNAETATFFRMLANGNYTFTGAGTFSSAAFSSTISTGNTNTLTGGNSGTIAVLTDNYFTINCVNVGASFADATTYYWSDYFYEAGSPRTTVGQSLSGIIYDCTLVGAAITAWSASSGTTNEATTVNFRKGGVDNVISNAVTFNSGAATAQQTNVTGLNVSCAAGDTWELKIVTPTWATNPTGAYIKVTLYFARR